MSADNKYKKVFTQSKTLAAEMTKVTHAELLNMVENAQLTPGAYYRITDYVAVFSDTYNHFTSAGHQFDIITMALSENTLSENCSAMINDNDNSGYFENNNLEAWEIKYAITQDEDTPRFYNYDPSAGKGYIYSMTDEFGNTAPCDFKNRLRNGYYLFTYEHYEDEQTIIEDFSLNPNCYQNTVTDYIKNYDTQTLPEGIIVTTSYDDGVYGNKIYGNVSIEAEKIINNVLTGDIVTGGDYVLALLENCRLVSEETGFLRIDIEVNYHKIRNTTIYASEMSSLSGLQFTGGSSLPVTENCTFTLFGLHSQIDMHSSLFGTTLRNLKINGTSDADIYMSALTADKYVILKYNSQNSNWVDMSISLQTVTP